jgi:hypothetical protein
MEKTLNEEKKVIKFGISWLIIERTTKKNFRSSLSILDRFD